MDKIKIFDYYKEYRLKNNLGKIFEKKNYSNNNIKEFLTENIYDNNIKKIIIEYKRIVSKIEERINKDWIIKNCTEINRTDDTDGTNLICDEYKNKNMGIGDWGLGIGDWGLGIGPNPQSPIPNNRRKLLFYF